MMNVRPTQSKQAQAGFTLVELSIVLGVMTVLAVNFTPSFIAAQREGLAEQTVETYYRLADAAVAYRANNDNWPGINPDSGNCAMLSGGNGPGGMHNPPAFGDNTFGHAADETNMALKKLAEAGYIPSEDVRNPWDGDFILRGVCLDGDECESCGLDIISQAIPSTVGKMVSNLLPLAEEPDDSGNVQDITMRVNPDALGGGDGGGGGGEMPSGAIMMSVQDCPEGWSEYDMAGRMPVGTGYFQGSNYGVAQDGGKSNFRLRGTSRRGLGAALISASDLGELAQYWMDASAPYLGMGGPPNRGMPIDAIGIDTCEGACTDTAINVGGTNVNGLEVNDDWNMQVELSDDTAIDGTAIIGSYHGNRLAGGTAWSRSNDVSLYSPYRVLNFCQKD